MSKLRVSHFFTEFLAGFISYDSTLWRTLKPILLSPGKVSLEYIKGRRKSYINPFRFYFIVSIIYFLVIGLNSKWEDLNTSFEKGKNSGIMNITDDLSAEGKRVIEEVMFKTDSVLSQNKIRSLDPDGDHSVSNAFPIELATAYGLFKNNKEMSVVSVLDSLELAPTFFNKTFYHKVKDFSGDNVMANLKAFTTYFLSNISLALFLLMPLFTLFVWLVYLKKRYSYMEHLVFVFNTQTVLFLLLLIFFFVDLIMGTEYQWGLSFLLFALYLFLALRGFYQQSFFITLIKYVLLNGMYVFLGIVGGFVIFGVSLFFS
ncbi:MAG: DUF3667 domain-containing protein [Flavobacteriaceae bacterium]|nr:DUF3667 domain-containing protein [Flavobacteriaceae bacterium]